MHISLIPRPVFNKFEAVVSFDPGHKEPELTPCCKYLLLSEVLRLLDANPVQLDFVCERAERQLHAAVPGQINALRSIYSEMHFMPSADAAALKHQIDNNLFRHKDACQAELKFLRTVLAPNCPVANNCPDVWVTVANFMENMIPSAKSVTTSRLLHHWLDYVVREIREICTHRQRHRLGTER